MKTARPNIFVPDDDSPEPAPVARVKRRRPWSEKFADALRGCKLGVRGHSSFSVHFFCAAVALSGGLVLGLNHVEWCLVILCIGGVLTAELFNSALETLFHGLDDATKSRLVGVLDISAGAVLCAGVTAAAVGAVVFGSNLMK